MDFGLENTLTSSDDEEHQQRDTVAALFVAETDHMVSDAAAIDFSIRRDVVTVLVQRDKPWINRLLGISCLSLAAKMKKVKNFSIADFQEREEGFIFDVGTIRRMELLVLGALEWRMRSITPFSFFRYFISFFSPAQPALLQALKSHASQNVFKAQNGNFKMLEFKPSVVAATALLFAAYELLPVQFAAFRAAITSGRHVEELRHAGDGASLAPPSQCEFGERAHHRQI